MLVNTKTAARELGLSEYELRRGQKEGRYPALVIAGDTERPVLRWDVDMVRSVIEERMRGMMREEANQE